MCSILFISISININQYYHDHIFFAILSSPTETVNADLFRLFPQQKLVYLHQDGEDKDKTKIFIYVGMITPLKLFSCAHSICHNNNASWRAAFSFTFHILQLTLLQAVRLTLNSSKQHCLCGSMHIPTLCSLFENRVIWLPFRISDSCSEIQQGC